MPDYQVKCKQCGQSYWKSKGHNCPVDFQRQMHNQDWLNDKLRGMEAGISAMTPHCPKCKSTRLLKKPGPSCCGFSCCASVFLPILLPLLFFLPRGKTVCLDCGLEW
jgi:hypothetical protein